MVGKVNVDEQNELAARFGVMSIPTLLVFKGGEIVSKAGGGEEGVDQDQDDQDDQLR